MSFFSSKLATQQIDYTACTYDDILTLAKGRIPSIAPEWTDTTDSDLGIAVIQLVAGMVDMLKNYQDRSMNEAFISTAQTRKSMTYICALINYTLSNAQSATMPLTIQAQLDPVLLPSITLPTGTQAYSAGTDGTQTYFELTSNVTIALPANTTIASVSSNTVFTVNSAANIVAGSSYYVGGANKIIATVSTIVGTTITLTAALANTPVVGDQFASPAGLYNSSVVMANEGQTQYQESLGFSDGLANQTFQLKFPSVLDDNANGNTALNTDPNQIFLYINEGSGAVLWTEVQTLTGSGPNDNAYMTSTDNFGYTSVILGNNYNGRVPVVNAQITATYRVGGGVRGNIQAGAYFNLVAPINGIVSITNPEDGSGGADAESINQARAAAPANLATQGRAVTAQDFATLCAEADSSVIAAQATTIDWNTVQVYVLTNEMSTTNPGIPIAAYNNIVNYVTPKMMVTSTLSLVPAVILPVTMVLNLYVLPGFSAATTSSNVMQALLNYFALGELGIGQSIDWSLLATGIQAVSGVSYVDPVAISYYIAGGIEGGTTVLASAAWDIAIPIGSVATLASANITINTFGGY